MYFLTSLHIIFPSYILILVWVVLVDCVVGEVDILVGQALPDQNHVHQVSFCLQCKIRKVFKLISPDGLTKRLSDTVGAGTHLRPPRI